MDFVYPRTDPVDPLIRVHALRCCLLYHDPSTPIGEIVHDGTKYGFQPLTVGI